MFTNLFKSFFALLLFALSELVISSFFESAPTTHGIILLAMSIVFAAVAFAVHVDKWANVQKFIADMSDVMDIETMKRLAPIANNTKLLTAFLKRYGTNYEAKVSELEQTIAKLKAKQSEEKREVERLYSETVNALATVKANAKQALSERETRISELQRTVSELQLQLNNWKAKYEALESGTPEQRRDVLQKMYRTAVNTLNGMKR